MNFIDWLIDHVAMPIIGLLLVVCSLAITALAGWWLYSVITAEPCWTEETCIKVEETYYIHVGSVLLPQTHIVDRCACPPKGGAQ